MDFTSSGISNLGLNPLTLDDLTALQLMALADPTLTSVLDPPQFGTFGRRFPFLFPFFFPRRFPFLFPFFFRRFPFRRFPFRRFGSFGFDDDDLF